MLHQGNGCNGTDHCGSHELQSDVQPLRGGARGELAPLVQLQEPLVLLLKPGRGQERNESTALLHGPTHGPMQAPSRRAWLSWS